MNQLELLIRTGFLVKGLLYIVIGVLALQVAAGLGGRVTGTRGALLTVLGEPFGHTLLLIAAVGLFGYAVWRVLQGLLDSDRLGHAWRAVALRLSYVGRGAVHAALGLQVVRIYRGLSQSSGTSEREMAAEAFRWPLGDWLVVLAGVVLIGFAVHQVYAAITSRLERDLDLANLRRNAGEWAVTLSRFGGEIVPVFAPEDIEKAADRLLRDAVKEVTGDDCDVAVTTRLAKGHPAEALLAVADDAELLVVGSRGHGGFAGMLLGSVSNLVVQHARCPVVVIRP
jgi:nucleotide-binding universal stress UspA family protein